LALYKKKLDVHLFFIKATMTSRLINSKLTTLNKV
jgi:hypothetical protein